MALFHPQDVFLQEYFLWPEYVSELRDTWREMLEHINRCCLNNFNRNAPADLRSRYLSEQPDIVWSGQVISKAQSRKTGTLG